VAKILQYGAHAHPHPPPKAQKKKRRGSSNMYPKKMGGVFFFLFPNFVIWRVFPKNTKISQIGSRQKKKPNCLGPKKEKICRGKNKKKKQYWKKVKKQEKKIRKKVQNLQQQ